MAAEFHPRAFSISFIIFLMAAIVVAIYTPMILYWVAYPCEDAFQNRVSNTTCSISNCTFNPAFDPYKDQDYTIIITYHYTHFYASYQNRSRTPLAYCNEKLNHTITCYLFDDSMLSNKMPRSECASQALLLIPTIIFGIVAIGACLSAMIAAGIRA